MDICPVGALTSKDFRFQMRVWFLKETKSLCTSCATGCNIVIGSREEKIYRYEPRENDAVNSRWMCDYGRLNYKWIGRATGWSACVGHAPSQTHRLPLSAWPEMLKEISEQIERSGSRNGGDCRLGAPNQRRTLSAVRLAPKARGSDRFRSAHRRRR